MKDEFNIENTDLNPFEAPDNLWSRVEAGLDQQTSKRRVLIWWWAAAGIAILGIGYIGVQFLSNNKVFQDNVIAKNELPEVPLDSSEIEKPNMVANTNEDSVEYLEFLPEELEVLHEPELETITTTVPFMQISPAPNNVSTYTWTSPNSTPLVNGGATDITTVLSAVPGVTSQSTTVSTSANFSGYMSPAPTVTWDANTTLQSGTYGVITNNIIAGNVSLNQTSSNSNTAKGNYEVNQITNGSLMTDSITFGLGEFLDPISSSTYEAIQENAFKPTSDDPLSTFSIDVDGASYSDVRGMINRNTLPNPNAVRLEEFINYFPYEYDEPTGEHPFSINTEFSPCPWNSEHQLLKVGIKGESIEKAQLPTNNLVFLLDVSGSMNNPEKLELLKKGFRLLVNELREEDRVAIAVYAGAAGLVLPPTSGANKDQILDALNKLSAGGSTAGGEGINLAYKTAQEYFDPQGNNRIILATDGDFNVGVSGNDALVKLIEEKRKSGVYLTVLGFGHDNFQSDKMEKIANNGNGNFSFIDNILEAKKVLVTEMGATLKTIAKDVKIQVEFNPTHVGSYRLLGYENRMLQHQDFANDTIDAGELGAGHTVTAVYEIIPPGVEGSNSQNGETELKYTQVETKQLGLYASELATVKFRYKHPDGVKSKLIEQVVLSTPEMKGSPDFEFIQSVIEFGLIIRGSQYAGDANFDSVIDRATKAIGDDKFGYRKEFIMLVEKARTLSEVWDY
ncbi:MAG: von Willebrand factor type A domain-containing protein [Crocinitomicaceae bacterium]